jgi:hypothetical protein
VNAATVPGSPPRLRANAPRPQTRCLRRRLFYGCHQIDLFMAAWRTAGSGLWVISFYQNTFQRPTSPALPASPGQRRPGRAGTRAPRLEIHRQPPCTPRRSRCRSSSLLFRFSASPATLLRLGRLYKDRGLKPSQVLNESPSRVIRRQAMIQPLVHSESKPLWPFYSHVERQRSRVC